ncbi:hypothetical protein TNIN_270841 [Trichonephila inaurata madagascariensis]|uniref:Sulfotransferase domain-containing protein n=1 Tax=Trichonephila inaurata madagascariensis TaxID=2747483 RepID=A0A8X7BTJ0_9ARAC|nr:hypothetical protein TNIN_270841 [Trichonephila inaurata madagascariensis]
MHKNDGNLLLISYEKLFANRKEGYLRIAKFLGEEYYQNIVNDKELLNRILQNTHFDYMKNKLYFVHPTPKEIPKGSIKIVEFLGVLCRWRWKNKIVATSDQKN